MTRDATLKALQVNWLNLALGHETFDADGATFVLNPKYPAIFDANFVFNARASSGDEVSRLMARARREYAHCDTLTFHVGPGSSPALESRLGLIGRERNASLVMLLEGPLVGTSRMHDLRPIEDEAGWSALAELKRASWREHAPRMKEDPERIDIPDGLTATSRLKCLPIRYFMAYIEDRPVGFFNAWEGVEGIGQVEDLFVLPEHRHHGIGTALIHRCVEDARAHGAGSVVICADPTDAPKAMYAAMGWRPVAVYRQYGVER
jgi:GNAT superfamily N-acetyltransferase